MRTPTSPHDERRAAISLTLPPKVIEALKRMATTEFNTVSRIVERMLVKQMLENGEEL